MARRNRESNTQSDNTVETVPTEVQEDNVSTATPEAPASTEPEAAAEGTDTEATEAHEDKPVDLTDFQNAVEAAVAERDTATGELAVAIIEPANVEFRKLDGAKAKNKGRAWLNDKMRDAMNEMNVQLARAYLMVSDNLSAGGATKGERAPADPTEAFVQRIVGLRLATDLARDNVPEGVGEDWSDKANALYAESKDKANEYLAWTQADEEGRGDEPEVSPVVRAAVKLAQGKSAKVGGGSRSGGGNGDGVRRDVAKHIQAAFADKEPGTFLTIAEIKKHESEEYAGAVVSAGAISARLFPASGKCTVEGVEPATVNNKKGARKI